MLFFFLYISCVLVSAKQFDHIRYENNDVNYPTPIVLWHGMGDTCCNPISLGSFMKFLKEKIPGVYIHSLQIGNGFIEDMENSFLMNSNTQVEMACEKIKKDNILLNGYNAIGFSQGGQFLRALVQRCPQPPMFNLVSLGGQHQGVYGLPHCFGEQSKICDFLRELLNHAAYKSWVQERLVQAQYWHDPLNEDEYKNKSIFLADINNEKVVNQTYIDNLRNLKNLILVKFSEDSMVDPKDSEWFGFFKPGQSKIILPLNKTSLYKEDRLGLRELDISGRIHYLEAKGDHLQIDENWFESNIINKFLK